MNQMNKFISNAIIKELNEKERSIVHFISTEDVDRHGDVVRADGMDLSNYNGTVLFGHNYNSFPVGKNLWIKVVTDPNGQKGILAKTRFNKTPEGEISWELFKDGDLNSFSIGFLPLEYNDIETGYEFTKWELLEYSVVPVPANPRARVMMLEKSVNADERFKAVINEQIKEFEMEDLKKNVNELGEVVEALKEKIAKMEEQLAELEYVIREDEVTEEEWEAQAINGKNVDEDFDPKDPAGIVGLSLEDKQRIVREAVLGAISQVRGKV